MLDATIQLLFFSTKVTPFKTDHYLKVYKAIVILIFSACLHLSASNSDVQKIINNNIAKIQQCFSDWVSDTAIIGRDMFGGTTYLKYAVDELKVRCI